jgi:hypothetical protein
MRGIALLFVFVSSVASAQIANKRIGELDGAATLAGAGVAVSPKSNKNIIAYAAGKVMYSNDAGATWTASSLQLPAEVKGTPTVASDAKGNFFLLYSTLAQIICHHSTDDGKTWSEPVIIATMPGKELYNPAMGTHPKKEEMIVTWTQADKFGSADEGCKSDVMLSTSGNGGKKWSKAIQINQNSGNCIDEDFTLRGSRPLLGIDGKTFVVWAGQGAMFYDRSYDGNMWISTDLAIAEQVGGWTLNTPGFGKVANTLSATIENSPSRIQGTLFVVYSDLKSGEKDTDIWLMRSVNRGDNWTVAARINQDKPGREQFMPRISIDLSNGYVYILYYDRRDYTDNQTDVYLAWSVDGGNQFKEKKINEKSFTPDLDAVDYLANYIGISAQKGIIVPVWTVIQNGKQEVWTAVIKQEELK